MCLVMRCGDNVDEISLLMDAYLILTREIPRCGIAEGSGILNSSHSSLGFQGEISSNMLSNSLSLFSKQAADSSVTISTSLLLLL